jgi:hypothetical protein
LENNVGDDNIFEYIETTLDSDETDEDESVADMILKIKNRKTKGSNFQISQESENVGQENQFWDEDFVVPTQEIQEVRQNMK